MIYQYGYLYSHLRYLFIQYSNQQIIIYQSHIIYIIQCRITSSHIFNNKFKITTMKKIKSTLSHNSTKINLFGDKSVFKHSKNTISKVDLQTIHCQSVQKNQNSSTYKKILDKPYYTNSKTSRINEANKKYSKQNINKKVGIFPQKKNSISGIQNQKSKRTAINLSSNKLFHCGSHNNILIEQNNNKKMECQQVQKIQKIKIQQFIFNTLTEFEQEQQRSNPVIIKDIINEIINNIFDKNILALNQKSLQNKRLTKQIIDIKLILEQNTKNYRQNIQTKDQELQKIKTNYEQEKENYRVTIDTKDTKIRQLQKNLQNIIIKQSQSSEQNKFLQNEIQKLKNQVILLEKQNETYKKQIINIRKEVGVLKKQNSTYKKNLEQSEKLNLENEIQNKDHIQKLQKYINLTNSLQCQLEDCKKQLNKSETQKILQFNNLLTNIKQQNFNLSKTIQSLQITINYIQKKNAEEKQRFKMSILKENRIIKEKNKKLIKNNILLKRILEQEENKFDSIEFFLEDKPEDL